MPNWAYLLVTLVYNLSLSLWIGGAVALGALAAPTIFGRLDSRAKAGEIFGAILRKFSRLRLVALVFAIGAAGVKYLSWEKGAASQHGTWLALRWAALAVMAAAVLYEVFYLESALARHRENVSGAAFQRLHRRSELVMSGSTLAAVAALLIN